ncbi:MAG: GNAT family N-acetyltransferase [Candidatus Moranbacteria bacterium]|nr:GNAT family N-acetyltransferase [Candidatus Moranbacteria bacterium]
MIAIVQANIGDINSIINFEHKLGRYELQFNDKVRPDKNIEDYSKKALKYLIEDEKGFILLAKEKNQPIGFIIAEIFKHEAPWAKEKNKGVIGLMYIEKKYRNQKIGEALLKKALKWFKKNKVKDIRLHVNARNLQARKFYQKIGFIDYNIEMTLK